MTSHNPAPTDIDEILDPRWLEAVLYKDFPGVEVTGTEVVESTFNTATKTRVAIEVRNAPPNLVKTICIKGMLSEVGKLYLANGVAKTEALFYQELAEPLSKHFKLPPCLYAGIDPATNHGLIIMQDLVAAGCTFLQPLTPYTADEAYASLESLARLHTTGPEGSALYNTPWLEHTLETRMARNGLIPPEMLHDLLNGPRGDPLPKEILDGHRLQRSMGLLAQRFRDEPSSLVHGDAHAGNLYRLPGDKIEIGLIDWQLIQQGYWAQDVAYHLGAALSVEDRRKSERELLAHYLDRLAAFGGPVIDKDAAWNHYRMAMLYGYYLWGVTRRVDPPIIMEFVLRLGTAVADLDSFKLVEA